MNPFILDLFMRPCQAFELLYRNFLELTSIALCLMAHLHEIRAVRTIHWHWASFPSRLILFSTHLSSMQIPNILKLPVQFDNCKTQAVKVHLYSFVCRIVSRLAISKVASRVALFCFNVVVYILILSMLEKEWLKLKLAMVALTLHEFVKE